MVTGWILCSKLSLFLGELATDLFVNNDKQREVKEYSGFVCSCNRVNDKNQYSLREPKKLYFFCTIYNVHFYLRQCIFSE